MQNNQAVLPITVERQDILNIKTWMKNNGMNPGDFIISPSTIRLEDKLAANKDAYPLDVKENKGAPRPTENRLSLNDLFFVSEMAIKVTKADESTTPIEYGNQPLFTYPDPEFFAVANEAKSLETIWNGTSEFKTSTVSRIPKLLNYVFREVPESTIKDAAFVGATVDTLAQDNQHMGFHRFGQLYIMDGSEDNIVRVELASGLRTPINGAANPHNILVVLLKGYVVSEGARKALHYIKQNPFI